MLDLIKRWWWNRNRKEYCFHWLISMEFDSDYVGLYAGGTAARDADEAAGKLDAQYPDCQIIRLSQGFAFDEVTDPDLMFTTANTIPKWGKLLVKICEQDDE